MTYNEAEAYIHSFTRFGSQLGLDRMRRLLDRLGNPQKALRYVHIAGTNGKGSTANLTASILQSAGYRVGLFTSPFVITFRERYQINGQMISPEEFTSLVEEIKPHILALAEQGDHVTEFEMVTAIGFTWFARQKCHIVALEVGLGGRFDATNVIPTPDCAIITAIGLDHTSILGNSIEQIAFEKAGIIKENTDVVTYPLQSPEAVGVLFNQCAQTNSRLLQPNPGNVEILESTADGSTFSYDGEDYHIRLAGKHQIYNAVAVREAINVLRQKGFSVSKDAIRRGMDQTTVPARFEILCRKPLVVLDGAHNPPAAAALAGSLDSLGISPKIAVMGMMKDKDYPSFVHTIASRCTAVVCTTVSGHPRALPPEELAEAVRADCSNVQIASNAADAWELATSLARENGMVIICGSFYLATEFLELAGK